MSVLMNCVTGAGVSMSSSTGDYILGGGSNWLDSTNTGNPLWIDNTGTSPNTILTGPYTTGGGTLGNLNNIYSTPPFRVMPTPEQLADPMFFDLWERFKFMESIGADHIVAMIEAITPYIEALEEAQRILSRPPRPLIKQRPASPPPEESEASPFDQVE